MLIFENIILAIRGLLVNKMRAMLTMLGIIIGIGSVIAIMTVGSSMTNSVATSMQSMGANNITVSITQKSSSDTTVGGRTRMFMAESYSDEDLISDEMINEFTEAYADDVYAIGLTESLGQFTVTSESSEGPVSTMGVNMDYENVDSVKIINGRFLNENDNSRKVAVISSLLSNELFPNTDPIGKEFTLENNGKIYTFYIIGVYQYSSDGSTSSTTDEIQSTTMYIPLDTAKAINGSANGYSTITVVSNSTTDTLEFLTKTENFFSYYYNRNNSYTISASSIESMIESMTEMLSSISMAIAIIAGISLLVGGIGVMNIMMVSITERTREIGTRKALGATNGSIRIQFIVEAMIICLVGGIIGIILGVILGSIGATALGYSAYPSLSVILLAVSFSMVIGVFFGYYPANKAAKMDPVEALRYE